MNIRADLNQTAYLANTDFEWLPSPLAGVERVLLDRVGDEVAVATSLVRYAPGAKFDAHVHTLGEEFVVLEGVFSDEHGDYPVGSYLRNPPGTSHTPHSDPGCVIFVKLRQFADDDLTPVITSIPMQAGETIEHELYRYKDDYARELLVLSGELDWQQEVTHRLGAWSWIRMSPGDPLRVTAVTDCVLFSKTRPVYRSANG
jgi:quercetin dioxygenase-like cupin family protein